MDSSPDDAPKTKAEKKFSNSPDFAKAEIRGRIIHSVDGTALSFDTGKNWYPTDKTRVADAEPLIGDLAYCNESPNGSGKFFCFASHNGKTISVPQKLGPASPAQSTGSPTTSAVSMISTKVDVGYGWIEAMVDTGCAFPMSMPKVLANALLDRGLATRAGSTTTILADGKSSEVEVIMIKSVTVDSRGLQDVEAAVSPNDEAPILLGLGALKVSVNWPRQANM